MGVQPARRRAAHADAVVGGAAADALGHVHAVAAAAAGCAVVLRAAEVPPLPGHLRQRRLLHTPAPASRRCVCYADLHTVGSNSRV